MTLSTLQELVEAYELPVLLVLHKVPVDSIFVSRFTDSETVLLHQDIRATVENSVVYLQSHLNGSAYDVTNILKSESWRVYSLSESQDISAWDTERLLRIAPPANVLPLKRPLKKRHLTLLPGGKRSH